MENKTCLKPPTNFEMFAESNIMFLCCFAAHMNPVSHHSSKIPSVVKSTFDSWSNSQIPSTYYWLKERFTIFKRW